MKGVILTGFLFATATVAAPTVAAAIDPPVIVADLQRDATEKLELSDRQRRESLLQDVKRRQDESLLQRQMHQLEQLRQQAERDAARAEKLQRLKENS
ncbi:hypothetical protein SAMN04487965_2002 [Microbulbifer donghaiensis]|uniref:Uncharacterized protein n=1 Tax=Microbulbifer donghaiensis TaxID=494016 RepID=A0A1M5AY41_9GAMM|nr:hypothetical protein [Microbulbifer donghaiensis]SHF34997.1 hypothetical protein SAMN04487965_2002 [Microbulbifer donghaiensis]